MHTIDWVVQYKKAHCLEAAMAAAVILEHHGYPPLIMDLESADHLDHTLFIFKHKGKYGAVGMSRDVGLYGRKPVFKTLRALAKSYAIPYIDHKAEIKGFGVINLRKLKRQDWRTSKKNVWYVEEALNDNAHAKLSLLRHHTISWRNRYNKFKRDNPKSQPDYYPDQKYWM